MRKTKRWTLRDELILKNRELENAYETIRSLQADSIKLNARLNVYEHLHRSFDNWLISK